MKRHILLLAYFSLHVFILSACTPIDHEDIVRDNSNYTYSTLIEDLKLNNYVVKLGINVDLDTYSKQLSEFNNNIQLPHSAPIFDIYTVRNPYTLEYGFIYEIHSKEALNAFFLNRCEYSVSKDEIAFIYKIDYYVLEMYHSTQSDFINILETHEFEANDLYKLFYTDEMEHHPFIMNLIEDGAMILEEYSAEDLLDNSRYIFSRSNINYKSAINLSYIDQGTIVHILFIEARNREDALTGYYEQKDIYAFPGNYNVIFMSYQNLVIIYYTMGWDDYSLRESLMELKEYRTYSIHEYWTYEVFHRDNEKLANWENG